MIVRRPTEGIPAGITNHAQPLMPEWLESRSPIVWLPPESLSGTTDGASVQTWTDWSGNSNSPTQAVAGKRPIYHATGGANSKPYVQADGTDDELFKAFTWNQPNHLWVVCKYNTVVDDRSVVDGSAVNTGRLRTTVATNSLLLTAGAQIGPLSTDIRNWHYIEVQLNGASSKFSADGGAYVSGDAGASARGGLSLFNSPATGAFAAASISEVIGFSSILNAAGITAAQNYLHGKYGL